MHVSIWNLTTLTDFKRFKWFGYELVERIEFHSTQEKNVRYFHFMQRLTSDWGTFPFRLDKKGTQRFQFLCSISTLYSTAHSWYGSIIRLRVRCVANCYMVGAEEAYDKRSSEGEISLSIYTLMLSLRSYVLSHHSLSTQSYGSVHKFCYNFPHSTRTF